MNTTLFDINVQNDYQISRLLWPKNAINHIQTQIEVWAKILKTTPKTKPRKA